MDEAESSHAGRAREMVLRGLLACGIASGLLSFAGDVVLSARYEGYSYLHQTISELNAFGAPTRGLSLAFGLTSSALLTAFAVGIWGSAPGSRRLQVVGGSLAALGVFSLWSLPFAAMQPRGVEQEGLHLVAGSVGLVLLVAAMAFASTAFGTRFRLYSIATILVMLAFGGWAATYATRVEAGLPTPWVGPIERVSFYSWYLWFIVLAFELGRRGAGAAAGRLSRVGSGRQVPPTGANRLENSDPRPPSRAGRTT